MKLKYKHISSTYYNIRYHIQIKIRLKNNIYIVWSVSANDLEEN